MRIGPNPTRYLASNPSYALQPRLNPPPQGSLLSLYGGLLEFVLIHPRCGMMLTVLRKVFAIVAGCIGFVFGVGSGLQLYNDAVLPFLAYTLSPNNTAYGDIPLVPILVPFLLGLFGAWSGVKVHSKFFPEY